MPTNATNSTPPMAQWKRPRFTRATSMLSANHQPIPITTGALTHRPRPSHSQNLVIGMLMHAGHGEGGRAQPRHVSPHEHDHVPVAREHVLDLLAPLGGNQPAERARVQRCRAEPPRNQEDVVSPMKTPIAQPIRAPK